MLRWLMLLLLLLLTLQVARKAGCICRHVHRFVPGSLRFLQRPCGRSCRSRCSRGFFFGTPCKCFFLQCCLM
jgi:hypothetical protein